MHTQHKTDLSVYLLTDRAAAAAKGRPLLWVIEQALKGGVSIVQLRDKTLPNDQFVALGRQLRRLTRRYGVPLIVNDRAQFVSVLDADGAHVGQSDMSASETRQLIGPNKILGISAYTVAHAQAAQAAGADYIGVGPVFPTTTKKDAAPPMGLEALSRVVRGLDIPAVAIGGVRIKNAEDLLSCGVDGLAIIGELLRADDPEATAQAFQAIAARHALALAA